MGSLVALLYSFKMLLTGFLVFDGLLSRFVDWFCKLISLLLCMVPLRFTPLRTILACGFIGLGRPWPLGGENSGLKLSLGCKQALGCN